MTGRAGGVDNGPLPALPSTTAPQVVTLATE